MIWVGALADLHWASPWALLALPLAVLPWLRRASRQGPAAGPLLLHPDLLGLAHAPPRRRRAWAQALLRSLAIAAWVVALAQPQRLGAWIASAPLGRDIVVLLDTSLTMSLHDLRWDGQPASRLAVAQQVFARFAAARQGDRFSIITFGKHAATLLPPTFDARAAGQTAQLLGVGQLGNDTALGDGIALALREVAGRAHGGAAQRPVVILYSDGGVSNTGSISPADAVAMARHLGVRIDTVEVGTDADPGGTYTVAAYPGPQPDLRRIAEATGGRFFFAAGPGAQQAAIDAIGRLNPQVRPPPTRRAAQPLFALPLLAGVAAWLLAALLALARRPGEAAS